MVMLFMVDRGQGIRWLSSFTMVMLFHGRGLMDDHGFVIRWSWFTWSTRVIVLNRYGFHG